MLSVVYTAVNGTEWPYVCWSAIKKLLTHPMYRKHYSWH